MLKNTLLRSSSRHFYQSIYQSIYLSLFAYISCPTLLPGKKQGRTSGTQGEQGAHGVFRMPKVPDNSIKWFSKMFIKLFLYFLILTGEETSWGADLTGRTNHLDESMRRDQWSKNEHDNEAMFAALGRNSWCLSLCSARSYAEWNPWKLQTIQY